MRVKQQVLALATCMALAMLAACGPNLEQRLEEIRLQQEIGSWDESVEGLREVIEAHPENPEANLLLGLAQLRLGQPALAIWPLETASRTAEWANRANLALGGAYLQLDQPQSALDAVAGILANPDDETQRLSALRLRAGVHFSEKDWEAALEDTDRILAANPDDVEAQLLRSRVLVAAERPEEAKQTLQAIWESPELGESGAGAQAGVALVQLYAEHLDDPERADRQLAAVVERFPSNRQVLNLTVRYFSQKGRPERASELLRSAVAAEPADVELRGILAGHLRQQGAAEEGEAILVEATELQNTPNAWYALAEYRRQVGDSDGAVAALEQVLEQVPGVTDYLRFKYAGMLADAGQLERAAEVASEITDPTYRDLVAGRVAYDQGDPQRALELLESGLRRWPNNSGARYLAGQAAGQLGDVDRAIAEYREAIRVDPTGTDAINQLARIQLAMGKPAAAVSTIAMLTRRGATPAPLERRRVAAILTARAQAALGQDEALAMTLDALAQIDPVLAAVERANLAKDSEAAIQAIEASGLDLTQPVNEPALRALCQQLAAAGRAPEALERVDGALAAHPDEAALHDLRGRLLVQTGRNEEARAALDRALELEPERAATLAALAEFAFSEGDSARGDDLLRRAAAADPHEAAYPYRAAQLSLATGRSVEAEALLRETLRRDPVHVNASNDLAWILAERGEDLDLALRLAQRARRADESPAVLDTLGWVRFKRGEYENAVQVLERAHELEPESPSIAYRLSVALLETGDEERARSLLREALAGDAFPEAEQAQQQLDRLAAAGS